MASAATESFPGCDAAILAAAVADYAPSEYADKKIKRESTGDITIKLVKNPDIAASLGKMKTAKQLLVGFALETDHEEDNALKKIKSKNLDWIVLNSLNDPQAGFQKDTNKITILSAAGEKTTYPAKQKKDVACDIIDKIFQ
jgi:phosphopantothenoylcysteine decarboxylase/phosphopantothenate--cysteine ligase